MQLQSTKTDSFTIMNTKIIRTPGVNQVEAIGRFCASAGYASIVRGVPSAGVTTALLALCDRYPVLKLPGTAYFYSFSFREDPAKAFFSAISTDTDRRSSKAGYNDSEIDRCFEHVLERDIRLLLFDRCHNLTLESVDRLLDMIEICLQRGRPIGFVLGGRNFNHDTRPWALCDRSKIARTITIPLLDRNASMSALNDLSPGFKVFYKRYLARDNGPVEAADEILSMTNGRIGELRKLVDYVSYSAPDAPFDCEKILTCARELTFHGYDSSAKNEAK